MNVTSKANRMAGQAAHTDRKYREGNGGRELAAWILYQMKRQGITQRSVAANIGVTDTMVRSVAYGKKTSARVQKAIAAALGYESWSALLSAFAGRGAAA